MKIDNQEAGIVAALVATIWILGKVISKGVAKKGATEHRSIAEMVENVASMQKDAAVVTREILKNQERLNIAALTTHDNIVHIRDTVVRVDRITEQIKDKQLAG